MVFKRNGSPYYQVEFEFKGHRIRRSSGTTTKAKAAEFERRLRQELHERVVLGVPVFQPMTIREAVERYITTHLKLKTRLEKTAKSDVYLLDGLIDWVGGDDVQIGTLTTTKIVEIRDRHVADRKPATVNRYLANLRAILRKANSEWGTLASVPQIKLLPQNNQRVRWLTKDEEVGLLTVAEAQPHLKNLLLFLLDTGARLSEAINLIWPHVELDRRPRGVVRFYNTKSGKPRSVPLTNRLSTLLRKLWEDRPEGQKRVFLRRLPGSPSRKTRPTVKPFTYMHGSWFTAAEKAGLEDVVIHDMRHTFASRLVQAGVPLLTVSKLLGHASLTMTMRYAHLAPENYDEAIAKLD